MKKTILITGATGGLGLEFCHLIAKEGHDLVISARNIDALNHLKQDLVSLYKIQVYTVAVDLSLPNSALELYNYTKENKIYITTLINNAGFGDFGRFDQSNWKKQSDLIQVNNTSLVHLTHLYLQDMKEKGYGEILNVASVASFMPGPLMSVYYASKAFVLSFTEALSVELKNTNIKVSVLAPGPTKTGFEENAALGNSGLFKNLKVADATQVAKFGLDALERNKTIAIPGFFNQLLVISSKFSPRSWVRQVVYILQK